MTKTADHPATLIVYGVNADNKPHAARFDKTNPELVAKAAALMGLQLHEVSSPAVAALGDQLPKGRLYANGNGFVPPVRKDVYELLSATIADLNRNAGAEDRLGCRAAGTRSPPATWSSPTKGQAGAGTRRLSSTSTATCSPCTGATSLGSRTSSSTGPTSH